MVQNLSRAVSRRRHSKGHDFSRFVRIRIHNVPQLYFELSQFNRVCNFILHIWNIFVAASISEYPKWPLSLSLFGPKFVSTDEVSMSATFSTNFPLKIFACNEIWWSVQIMKPLTILLPSFSKCQC
jgi:hypothetical protein